MPAKNVANTLLSIHVQPGAKRHGIAGEYGERLKIALKAPPVDGKANLALIKYVAELANVSKTSVTLITGETSREKRLEVRGINHTALLAAIDKAYRS